MNLQEFLEMKNEFADYIYKYEYFLKCGAINDCYYLHFFGDFLDEIRKVGTENRIMAAAIAMKSEGKPQEEIDKFLADQKELYNTETEKVKNKKVFTEAVIKNNDALPMEDKKQFEIDYLDYVKKNHPIVKCLVSPQEEQLFQILSKFYKENNYSAYKEILENNKNVFSEPEYKEEDFNKISAYYYDIKKNINADFLNKSKMYPYNKQETLKNEISIARENGDLKAKLNEYKGANKNIHKDFFNAFKFEYTLD